MSSPAAETAIRSPANPVGYEAWAHALISNGQITYVLDPEDDYAYATELLKHGSKPERVVRVRIVPVEGA